MDEEQQISTGNEQDINAEMKRFIIENSQKMMDLRAEPHTLPPEDFVKTHTAEEVRDKFGSATFTTTDSHQYLVLLKCAATIFGKSDEKVIKDLTHELDHFKGFVHVMRSDEMSRASTFGLIIGYNAETDKYGWKPFFSYPEKSEYSASEQYLILDLPEHKSPRDKKELEEITN